MKKQDTKTLVERLCNVHNNKYDYSKLVYRSMNSKVCIICHEKNEFGEEHGEFWQYPSNHLRGCGCPKCSKNKRKTTDEFINECKNKYPLLNIIYDKVEYKNNITPVVFVCPEHGEFSMWPSSTLKNLECPECQKRRLHDKFAYTTEKFVEMSREVHGDKYTYSKVDYTTSENKVCIVCPEHGEFWQTAKEHLAGRGCPKCKNAKLWVNRERMTTEKYIQLAEKIHTHRNIDYSDTVYTGPHDKLTFICKEHGVFYQDAYSHLGGCGCPNCSIESGKSNKEEELYLYIKNIYGGIIRKNDRTTINPMEIDITLPEKKISFELDGLYWHSENKLTDKNYHLNKTEKCLANGINLIHIFEDEYDFKRDIVYSKIKNLLGITGRRIFGRKTVVKEITPKTCKDFLEKNHLQGNVYSKHRYGLFYKNELVSVMTFGTPRKNVNGKVGDGVYEMVRFCNKLDTSVVGGASKLLKKFIEDVHPNEIISYCDRRWSNGNLYREIGFELSHTTKPNYYYVVKNKRVNRFSYRKDKLVKDGFPQNKTEHEIMLERKIYRIYDCGCLVFKYTPHKMTEKGCAFETVR